MHSRIVRRVLAVAIAAIAGGAASFVPASAAHAEDASPYSFYWHYYDHNRFQVFGSVAGGWFSGLGWDDGQGNRGMSVHVEDADPNDDMCAAVYFRSSGGRHFIAECQGQHEDVVLPTDMTGTLVISLQVENNADELAGPEVSGELPPANGSFPVADAGNGVYWYATGSHTIHFDMQYEHVAMSGDTTEDNGWHRTVSATLIRNDPVQCATASVRDTPGTTTRLILCDPRTLPQGGNKPSFGPVDMFGPISVKLCGEYPACIETDITSL